MTDSRLRDKAIRTLESVRQKINLSHFSKALLVSLFIYHGATYLTVEVLGMSPFIDLDWSDILVLINVFVVVFSNVAIFVVAPFVFRADESWLKCLGVVSSPAATFVIVVTLSLLVWSVMAWMLQLSPWSGTFESGLERLDVRVVMSQYEGNVFLGLVIVVALIPWGEELLIHGVLFGGLIQSGANFIVSILLSSMFFVYIHDLTGYSPPQTIFLFVMGCFIGFIRWRTGSVVLSFVGHMTMNTASLIYAEVAD